MFYIIWALFWVQSFANCGPNRFAEAAGSLLFWSDNILTECCWNAHSGVKWEDERLYVSVFLYTVCVWIAVPLPHCISLLYTVSFFLSSSVGRHYLPPSLFPSSLLFFHCLRRAAFPCFSLSLFVICIPVTPLTRSLSVLGHICLFCV